ncbi:hypothetical protein ACTA71_011411 [Dictyostelium dimigraforme]
MDKKQIPINNNDETFFKIWRNILIRKEILHHLRLYNIHFNEMEFLYFNQVSLYKYKSYLNKIKVSRCYNLTTIEPIEYGIGEISFHFLKLSTIEEKTIPTSVHTIYFGVGCLLNNINVIPNSVKTIKFQNLEKEALKVGVLPSNLSSIEFNDKFNQPFEIGVLPSTIKSIEFGNSFNQSLKSKYTLPINLTSIEFGYCFNKTFDFHTLINVATLILGDSFNKTLDKCKFPPNLTNLTFGEKFNQFIPGDYFLDLPLKTLKFGYEFDQLLDDTVLPSTLTSLDLGCSGNFTTFTLLNQLETLKMGSRKSKPIEHYKLPINSLKEISYYHFNNEEFKKRVTPIGIVSLTFDGSFNRTIGKGILPNSIKNLVFGCEFNQVIEINVLPINLTTLKIGGKFNQFIEKGVLPNSLTSLHFYGNSFNQIIEVGSLPNSITFLSLNSIYSQCIPIGSLPSSLKQFQIHSYFFKQDLSLSFDDYFTSSLESIYIPQNSYLVTILDPIFFSKYIKFIKNEKD